MKTVAWMVVKDDEFYVDMTLRSIMDHVSGMFILDTGSTDKTPEIIKSYEAKYPGKIVTMLKDFGSDKEFRFGKKYLEADARNFAMQNAISFFQPDWLLQVDSDEVFNGRFFEILESCYGEYDMLGHSTELPTSTTTISANPADMSDWNGIKLFDPHIRAHSAKVPAAWIYRIGAHVMLVVSSHRRKITEEHVHFHLHRGFGPKCVGTYITNFRCAYEGAAVELKVPLPKIFDQKYMEERFPDWFENGKFKPHKEVLQKIKAVSISCKLPDYVVEKWNEWGDWSNWDLV
jgi:glycosyltransferase involved in cell wall biosynthesis